MASTLPTVADAVIQASCPLWFMPEMYVERPEFADSPDEQRDRRQRAGVFDRLSHGALHEDPETFNRASLDALQRQGA